MEELLDIVQESLSLPLSYFITPNKRIHYIYLLSSLVLAVIIYFLKERKNNSIGRFLFDRESWFGKSAVIDYLFIFFNAFVKILLVAPLLIFSLKLAFYINDYLVTFFGYPQVRLSRFSLIALYTITVFVVNDFFTFFLHYLQHKIPFLWQFHKVHHSATVLNPMTQYRIHPFELVCNNIKNILIVGFIMGCFDYLAGQRLNAYSFMGVNVLSFLFLLMGSNLRHSNIPFKYPFMLEFLFISPFQHQIHHSNDANHHNRNMGSKLAVWDWMFGTLILSRQVQKLTFGLGKEDKHYSSFLKNLWMPFRQTVRPLRKVIRKKSLEIKKRTSYNSGSFRTQARLAKADRSESGF